MGINRFDKAPEWQPWTLPYDLILKAADMTQQRWDKGVADSDKIADDLFKGVKTVPGSVDESTNLPAIREQYNQMREQLITDPEINSTKFTSRVQQFAGQHKSTLDRMTNLASLYDANSVAVNANESNAAWRALNEYLPGSHIDPSRINSLDDKTPQERLINSQPTTNFTPFITDNFLKGWTPSNEVTTDPTTGQVISVGGKSIEDLELKAETNTAAYMQSRNFADYVNSQKLDDRKPDDVLSGYGKSFFGGKYFGDLDAEQKAKAMIMMAGATQINQKESMTVARKTSGNGNEEEGFSDPYIPFLDSKTVSNKDFATIMNTTQNPDGSVPMTIPAGTYSHIAASSDDPEVLQNTAILSSLSDLYSNFGDVTVLKNAIGTGDNLNYVNSKAAKDLAKDAVNRATGNPLTLLFSNEVENSAKAIKEATQKHEDALNKLGEVTTKMEGSPQYLSVLAMLGYKGLPVGTPEEVSNSVKQLIKKDINYKNSATFEQQTIQKAISTSYFKGDIHGNLILSPTENKIDLGNMQVLNGLLELGTEEEIVEKLEDLDSDIINVDGKAGRIFDMGEFDSISAINEKYPGTFTEMTRTDKNGISTKTWGVNVVLPFNPYDTKKHQLYDNSMMTGDNADKSRGAFLENAVEVYNADRSDRLLDMFDTHRESLPMYVTSLAGVMATYSAEVQNLVSPILEGMKNDPEKHLQAFSSLYDLVTHFGPDKQGLTDYLVKMEKKYGSATSTENPTRPQGPANPLGAIKR